MESVFDEVTEHGPISARGLADPGTSSGSWWGHGKGKVALAYLFAVGRIAVAYRKNFERFYDIVQRVVPEPIREHPALDDPEAMRRQLRYAIRSLGIATLPDLCDYFRVTQTQAGPVVEAMERAGEVVAVEVSGWRRGAYADPDLSIPRAVPGSALVAPFDSLVWDRARTERMFGFHYRIEIYTPAPKRRFGYYVFPFRLDDHIVARVDLKADRQAGALLVLGAYAEDGTDRDRVARALKDELDLMAAWLGLSRVDLGSRG